jgi:hypothetical protein
MTCPANTFYLLQYWSGVPANYIVVVPEFKSPSLCFPTNIYPASGSHVVDLRKSGFASSTVERDMLVEGHISGIGMHPQHCLYDGKLSYQSVSFGQGDCNARTYRY